MVDKARRTCCRVTRQRIADTMLWMPFALSASASCALWISPIHRFGSTSFMCSSAIVQLVSTSDCLKMGFKCVSWSLCLNFVVSRIDIYRGREEGVENCQNMSGYALKGAQQGRSCCSKIQTGEDDHSRHKMRALYPVLNTSPVGCR